MWLKEFCKHWSQNLKMPKAARKSNCVDNTSKTEFQADSNLSHEASSDDRVVLQSPQSKPPTSQTQAMQQMYMPYIEGQKWTGLWMTACITDSYNGKSNVKTYWIVNWQCYWKQENVRKLWLGQVILALANMYHGACPKMNYAWRWYGTNLRSFANLKPIMWVLGLIS